MKSRTFVIGAIVMSLLCGLPLAGGNLGLGASETLNSSFMAELNGGGCGDNVGGMLTAGFVSGLVWVPIPVLGQAALLLAAVYGVGVLLTC
jgi:hypothetical protein